MIKIGDLAKICNVTTQALRYYDAEGILKPDITDESSGYRFYSLDAVEKYKRILFYKNLGFTLEEIKSIQSATTEELYSILQAKKSVLSQCIDKFKAQIKAIDELCSENAKKPILSELLLLPFENDTQVVGKWKLCGELQSENNFDSLKKINSANFDEEIIFMPGGAFSWKYFWTKGTLYRLSPKYTFAIPSSYKILKKKGTQYMVLQFMSDECIEKGEDITLLLYQQINNTAYTERQIRKSIDETDLPFINDDDIIGEWSVYDYVPSIDYFNPNSRHSANGDLYTLGFKFLPRGICYKTTRTTSGTSSAMLKYTKGYVLNDKEMTAEEYKIKLINGKEFLFIQHKSGDYFYGGMTPNWYVFKRNNN